MNSTSLYSSFVAVTRCVICWCSGFWIFGFSQFGNASGIKLIPFWLMSMAILVILKLFLRKSRPVNAMIAVSVALAVAETAAILLFFFHFDDTAAIGVAGAAVVSTVVLTAFRCTEPVSMARSISSMELTVVFLLFFLWLQSALKIDTEYCLPLFFAVILSISDIMYQRISTIGDSRSQTRIRSITVVSAMLVLVLIVMAAFVMFGVEPLGRGMEAIYHAVVYCVKTLIKLLIAFVMWFASLFPDPKDQYEYDIMKDDFNIPELGEIQEVNPIVAIILCVIAVLILLIMLGCMFYAIRKLRIGGSKTSSVKQQVKRRRMSLLAWIKAMISALYRNIVLRIRIMLARGSAKELYIFLTKAGRTLGFRRRKGETPCAFVLRASEMTGGANADMEKALKLLSDELSIALYSKEGQRPFPKAEAALIRSGFRKALHRARIKNLKARISSLAAR
ncbi:MAG: hypothetical protein IJF25_00830 [Oscillospiraceae bacterium]|nr:hypothetical protein [Oscillospiraceae bacterium]